MGLECGAPRPQVLKLKVATVQVGPWRVHDANANCTALDFLGHGLSACLDVKHAGCGLWNIFRLLCRKTLFIVEYQREVWQNMSGRMHVVSL